MKSTTNGELFPLSGELTEEEANALGPLVLAFVGDAAQALIVKVSLALTHSGKSGLLHKLAVGELSAVAQAEHFSKVEQCLTEAELSVFKRGRNAKVHSTAKNAPIAEYKRATGYEALIGYLYLTGQTDRLLEIMRGFE